MEESLQLREANEAEIPTLTKQAEKHLPHSLTAHGLLTVGFRFGTSKLLGTKIYVPEQKDFPFFILFTNVVDKAPRQSATCFWDPTEVKTEQAKLLLGTLPDWDWNIPMFFCACSLPVLRELELIVPGENGMCRGNLEHYVINEGNAYTITSVNPEHYTISDEFFLAPLPETLAQTIHSNWEFKTTDSEEAIRKIILTLPTMGVFIRQTKETGNIEGGKSFEILEQSGQDLAGRDGLELNSRARAAAAVSWLLFKPDGQIGFTFTFPSYRRKGLAGAATAKLAENVLEKNITPFVLINDKNLPSAKFHENIGFRKSAPYGWHLYVRKGMQLADF